MVKEAKIFSTPSNWSFDEYAMVAISALMTESFAIILCLLLFLPSYTSGLYKIGISMTEYSQQII
jgi:hypothetical protein